MCWLFVVVVAANPRVRRSVGLSFVASPRVRRSTGLGGNVVRTESRLDAHSPECCFDLKSPRLENSRLLVKPPVTFVDVSAEVI